MSAGGSAPKDVRAFIGLGSNVGDRLANLRRAVALLSRRAGLTVVASSRVYETDPVGPPQPDYLNAVVEVRTSLEARAVLEACLSIEAEMGRVRGERWGPRVIDLDVLTVDAETIEEPGLTVPHPRMHERAFVLAGLLELDPRPFLPGGRTIDSVRFSSAGFGGVRLFAPALTSPLFRSP
jgi:2-amino-4-hydroxy-6-hydroxymethyldihydropteridine diphosphokinase